LEKEQRIHADEQVIGTGPDLDEAQAVMIMVHGRGASAQDILGLSGQFSAEGMMFVAPQATANTWYPYSFLEPMDRNEPYLSAALRRLSEMVLTAESHGIPSEKIILLGFSQGACLATEFAVRNARRWGGVCGFSGGLIGPPGTSRDYDGSLDGTPVFLGCSDVDFHIPVERVHETEEVMRSMGAKVTANIYPGMGHTIIEDEVQHVQSIIDQVLSS
jgi:phospholipase/carboxylesterase